MRCGFCGKDFQEDRSQPACASCPLGSDCGLILCPHCGYENPALPGWMRFLKERFGRKKASATEAPPRGPELPVLQRLGPTTEAGSGAGATSSDPTSRRPA